jgi:NAD(P)-dependent dehydrogenase (short-subunit alcohol dehydrogenase family)
MRLPAFHAEVPDAKVFAEILDLADQSYIRAFAARTIERFPGESLDLLINNAGAIFPTREVTVDGFERQFATNYLGPFALTALLLPSIRPQLGSRIVTVVGSLSKYGMIAFDNLQSERRYSTMQACAQSKLAVLIFTLELQRRLTTVHSPILCTAAHPGYALTNIQAIGAGSSSITTKLMMKLMQPLSQTRTTARFPRSSRLYPPLRSRAVTTAPTACLKPRATPPQSRFQPPQRTRLSPHGSGSSRNT